LLLNKVRDTFWGVCNCTAEFHSDTAPKDGKMTVRIS
jgi:hypothetical protein